MPSKTEHSPIRHSNEIEETMEYQKWISRHRNARFRENVENSGGNRTPRHVNIFVKVASNKENVNSQCRECQKKGKDDKKAIKKRSIAIA